MINAKGLSLGNLLYFQRKIIAVTLTDLEWIKNGEKLYRPIPLTEEWLLRANFEEIGNNTFTHGNIWLCKKDGGYFFINDEWQEVTDKIYLYLHEIQNLVFVLSDYELKIKL